MPKNIISKLTTTGFFHIFGSGFLNKVISFASSFVLIRILSKSDYGIYSYAQNIINLFMIANGFGIVNGLLQILCENRKDNILVKEYSRKAILFGVAFDFFLAVIIFVYSFFVDESFNQLNVLLKLMMFMPLCDLCFDLIQIYHRGLENNKTYSYLSSINTILVFVLSVVGALFFNAEGLIIGKIISSILTVLIAISIFKFPIIEILQNTHTKLKEWNVVIKISFISMLNNSASIIMQNVDGILLGTLLNDADLVASYKVATYIPSGLAFLPQMLCVYIYPMFASHIKEKSWLLEKYKKLIVIFGGINLFITFLVIISSKFLVPILFGKNYIDSVGPLNILMITYFFNATFRNISGNLLASQRRLKANFVFGIIGIIINIVGDIILIPRFGLNGAAMATFAVVFCVAVASSIYLVKVFSEKV